MSKKTWIIIGSIIAALGVVAWYAWSSVKNITYKCSVKGLKLGKFSLSGGEVTLNLNVELNNGNPFAINIKGLYYEVYYKGALLAKSASTATNQQPIELPAKSSEAVKQDVQVMITKNNLGAATGILSQTPTDFTAKVKANIFGFNIDLKDLKFTY